jgi:hypothetical protein
MKAEKIEIAAEDILPEAQTILQAQGIRPGAVIRPAIVELVEMARSLFGQLAKPVGVLLEIAREEFDPVYLGIGNNASPAPIEAIYPQAQDLALSAVTIGAPVCQKISELFKQSDYALGSLLDAAASEGTERASQVVENSYRLRLATQGRLEPGNDVVAYSPGYCGWHISAQRKLFDLLKPEDIGIQLRDSFLMEPIKSISNVLIHGKQEIHRFRPRYPFCKECRTKTCLLRMNARG